MERHDHTSVQAIQGIEERESSRQHDQRGACSQYVGRGFDYRNIQTKESQRLHTECENSQGGWQCCKGCAKAIGKQDRQVGYLVSKGKRLSVATNRGQ